MELTHTRGQAMGPIKRLLQVMRQHPLLFFFVFALGFSGVYVLLVWGVLHAPTSSNSTSASSPWTGLLNLGMTLVGPTLAAFLMTAVTQGRAGIRQLLRRYVLWRVGIPWYLVVLPGVLVLMLLSYLLLPGAFSAFHWPRLFSLSFWLPYLIVYVAVFIAGGPLGEEPGWRGFALPRLQQRFGPLVGTLVLGVLHGPWHVPIFLVMPANLPGYHGAEISSVEFLALFGMFFIGVIALEYVFTWVFNNTRGSILLAIMLHASVNTAGIMLLYLLPSPTIGFLYGLSWSLVWVVAALIVIVATRGRLSYQRYQRETEFPPSVTDRDREM